jgi:dUTPase
MIVYSDNSTNLFLPQHVGDAGFDVSAFNEPNIVGQSIVSENGETWYKSIDFIEYDTNVRLAPDSGYHVLAMSRSSISKMNLSLCNGVGLIDNKYRGTIKFRFNYIAQPEDFRVFDGSFFIKINHDKIYEKGERIGQIVFCRTIIPHILIQNPIEESATSRGENGFGSTNA